MGHKQLGPFLFFNDCVTTPTLMAHASYFLTFLPSYCLTLPMVSRSHTLAYLYHPAIARASKSLMTLKIRIVSLAVIAAFFISCSSSKKVSSSGASDEGMEHVMLDTMMIHAGKSDSSSVSLPSYKPSQERSWDLQHTVLDLSFDWTSETVKGSATLTLSPVFFNQTSLRLDAIHFDVHDITIDAKQVKDYLNTGEEIVIPLPGSYKKGQQIKVGINYSAHPSASAVKPGAAISSDKGLFFIDPQDTMPGKPRQIWSQGETTNNSRWFPTLDQPNERGTQEVILTVADTMMTLSNGLLISSTPVAGGMRRDVWKLDLPIAPYLTMVAVGQWDKVTDYWRGRPVEYYVDPGYGPSAKAIFANTPEMIEFFSTKLGYEFVWPKYSQVIVKDFVSGAMENATAVVFGDFVQFNKDEIIEDGSNDYIVAHELFHHWFGDLVTCESWANLTLNEGFANYAEYLWQEYKYDRERADISRMSELSGYFDQAAYDAHPLIHYHYASEDDLFDAHSYNKGGLVLHMLRDVVGDDAFFASLQFYLRQNAFKATEVDDLRQAFEEVTGLDLHWFFDQWYFSKGHPVLDIKNSYDASQRKLKIDFSQTQSDLGFREVFILPLDIAIIHQDSSIEIKRILLDQKTQSFTFDEAAPPLTVVVDPRDVLLAVVNHDIPESEYAIRAVSALSISHRLSAFRVMSGLDPTVMRKLMSDSSYTIRLMLVSYLAEQKDTDQLYQLSLKETNPEIQFYILESIASLDEEKANDVALRLLKTTDKVPIISAALKAVAAVDVDEAIHQLAHFQQIQSPAMYAVQATIFAQKGNAITLDYFMTPQAAQVGDDYLEDFIGAMALYMSGQSSAIQDQGLKAIDSDFFLRTEDPEYRRFYLITGLLSQYAQEQDKVYKDHILQTINSLYRKETNEYLRGVLKEGLGNLLD